MDSIIIDMQSFSIVPALTGR